MSASPSFDPPQPWLRTTSGSPVSAVAGSATLTSSGTPANVRTRGATDPGQKRTPCWGAQASVPNGAGGAAETAAAGRDRSTRAASGGGNRGGQGGGTAPPARAC